MNAIVNAAPLVGPPVLPSAPSPTASAAALAGGGRTDDLAFLQSLLETSQTTDQVPLTKVPLGRTGLFDAQAFAVPQRKSGRSSESKAAKNQPEKQKQNGMTPDTTNIPSLRQDPYRLILDQSLHMCAPGVPEAPFGGSERMAGNDPTHSPVTSTEGPGERGPQGRSAGSETMQVAFVARVVSDDTAPPHATPADGTETEVNQLTRADSITRGSPTPDNIRTIAAAPSDASTSNDDTNDSPLPQVHSVEPAKKGSDSPSEQTHPQSVAAAPPALPDSAPQLVQGQTSAYPTVLTGGAYRNSMTQSTDPAANAGPGQQVTNRPEMAIQPDDTTRSGAQPAVRELTLRVGDRTSQSVDVRILDQGDAGVRVSVRSGDGELTSRLQSEIPRLVASLHDSGFDSDVWTPQQGNSMPHTPPAGRSDDGRPFGGSGHGSQQQPNEKQQHQSPRHIFAWDEEIAGTLAASGGQEDPS